LDTDTAISRYENRLTDGGFCGVPIIRQSG
jgi:hypothetical protein